jgi:hypothetical protein
MEDASDRTAACESLNQRNQLTGRGELAQLPRSVGPESSQSKDKYSPLRIKSLD